ncbi:MAG TPA: hypothetical protein VM536_20835, partial [Chloroflexia bacterium]|nr:hypothetical protein [Chloroflexia bacterium]
GAAFVVVVLPAREQVVDRYWEENRHALSLLPEQLDREAPQRRLAAWSARTGTPLIDLLPGMRAAGRDNLFLKTDPHLTPAGHALAAGLIRDGMARLGLLRP